MKKNLLDYYQSANTIETSNNSDKLLIYTLTFNMKGKIPSKEEITLLFPNINEIEKFDIYIINTQECLRSITASMFINSKDEWEMALQNFLGENYINVINQNLGAIHLSIFIKKEKLINFHNFRSGEIKTGFMNIFANKGAVSASMKYLDKNILFIGCHLAAGQDKATERNNDLLRIRNTLKSSFNDNLEDKLNIIKNNLRKSFFNIKINHNNDILDKKISESLAVQPKKSFAVYDRENKKNKIYFDNLEEVDSIHDKDINNINIEKDNENIQLKINEIFDDKNENNHLSNKMLNSSIIDLDDKEDKLMEDFDFVILSGDLNYRLDISQEDIEEIINQKNPEILWDKDQLSLEIKNKHLFKEGIINFMPTYKYKENTDEYDYKRIPAWTDRILFKSKKKYDIMLCEYNSIQNINISDHKPVYAIFKINFKNRKKNDNIYNINYEINNINNDKKCIIF